MFNFEELLNKHTLISTEVLVYNCLQCISYVKITMRLVNANVRIYKIAGYATSL